MVGAQLPNNGFGASLRQRQSYPSLCDSLADTAACRMIPTGVFDPLAPGLGRQSQCVTPEQVPLGQNILHERQLLPVVRFWHPKLTFRGLLWDLH